MKKQIILLAAIVVGIASSSFGQGYMNFGTSGKNWVYDDFTTHGISVVSSGTADVAFMIGNLGATPSVDAISTSNPSGNTANLSATAWTDILTDPNFSLGYNLSGPTLASTTVNTASIARGGFGYKGGAEFQVNGYGNTLATASYTVYVIAWNAAYATPTAAANAGAAVGWSNPFTYVLQPNTSTTPANFITSGMTAFGVSPVTPVPEPTTMALFGLGGLALLAFRRRS